MVRKLAVTGSAYLVGLLLASFFAPWLSCVMGGLFLCLGTAAALILRPDHGKRLFSLLAAAVSFGAGMLLYGGYDALVYERIVSDNGKEFSGTAVVSSVRVYSAGSAFCTAKFTLPCGLKGNVGWYADNSDIVKGDTAFVSGTLYTPRNTDFFSSKDYYESENVFLLLGSIDKEEYYYDENSVFRMLEDFRGKVCSQIRHYVPSDEGELIIGMVLGKRKWDMPRTTEKALYRSGIGHIASVSGMHIGLAAGLACAFSGALGLSKKKRFALILAASFAYAAIAEFSLSVTRALIMVTLVYCADLFKRQNDPLSSLCLAAFLMTAGSPFIIRSASFLLSFSGVFGAAVLAPWVMDTIKDAYEKEKDREMKPSALLSAAVVAVCASAAVIPASVMCFDEISVLSPVSNLILSPLYSAAAAIAFAGTVLTVLDLLWLSGGLFLSAGIICRPVLGAVRLIGSVSAASLPAGLDILPAITVLAVISALASILALKREKAIVAVCGSILISAVCITVYRVIPRENTEITLLTDGSGCVLIISENNSVSVFDLVGGKKGARAAESTLLKRDLGSAGLVVLSEKCANTYPFYKEAFPNARIVSSSDETDLTYSAENNIIIFGGVVCRFFDGYQTIETDGIRILCVNKKCRLPDEHFDLCILNCGGNISADADRYAVTEKRYSGELPAACPVSFCIGGEYLAKNGVIWERTERKWLR